MFCLEYPIHQTYTLKTDFQQLHIFQTRHISYNVNEAVLGLSKIFKYQPIKINFNLMLCKDEHGPVSNSGNWNANCVMLTYELIITPLVR